MNTALLAATLLGAAVSASGTGTASGRGTMSFGHEGEGRGFLRFSVRDGTPVSGSLTFAAEHHHDEAMFPDIVVTLGTFDTVSFDRGSVEFSGPGALHDDPVTVTVRAWDHDDLGTADRFVIECRDGGRTVFEADGTLIRGDIVVRTDEGG